MSEEQVNEVTIVGHVTGIDGDGLTRFGEPDHAKRDVGCLVIRVYAQPEHVMAGFLKPNRQWEVDKRRVLPALQVLLQRAFENDLVIPGPPDRDVDSVLAGDQVADDEVEPERDDRREIWFVERLGLDGENGADTEQVVCTGGTIGRADIAAQQCHLKPWAARVRRVIGHICSLLRGANSSTGAAS